jgi:hypothetical protein
LNHSERSQSFEAEIFFLETSDKEGRVGCSLLFLIGWLEKSFLCTKQCRSLLLADIKYQKQKQKTKGTEL